MSFGIRMSSSPGQYYYGELEDNTANGLGFGRFQDGTYIGNWKDGDMDGKGIFLHDDMTVLCGQWRSGKPLFETSKPGKSFCNTSLDFGPAIAAPAHCSVDETTFTFNSGQTNCK